MGEVRIDFSSVPMPVAMRFEAPVTDEELMRLSERNRPFRFERNREGEITMMSPVGGLGSVHEGLVVSALHAWNEVVGTGIVFFPNAGFNLPDGSCLAPDCAWLSLGRWEGLTLKEQTGFPPLCPEFVVEVRSPGDSRKMVETKMELWILNGAELGWLVDPLVGEVVIYRPGEPTETLERPEVVRGHGPVAGFELKSARLWNPR